MSETMVIESAEDFVRLRTSTDPEAYGRAAHGTASEAVWLVVITEYPKLRFWVAQNKTVPLTILTQLMHDPDPRVRAMVARKRKADDAILGHLAHDPDAGVRMAVARNPRVSPAVLHHLVDDPWAAIGTVVRTRLGMTQGSTPLIDETNQR